MSDVNAVAEVMGIPPELVSRSAAARAAEAGSTTDEILAAWGGGEAVATAPAETQEETPVTEEAEASPEPVDRKPEELPPPTIPGVADQPEPSSVAAGPYRPPVLVGVKDNPWSVLSAVLALFVGVLLLGLIGPSVQGEVLGARSTDIDHSSQGKHGQAIYGTLECSACHTQMVRPIVADVGIGPVSLADTDQVLGTRRFGPDLSNIGARMSVSQMEATVRGSGGHPPFNLSEADMSDLVTYLLESTTGPAG